MNIKKPEKWLQYCLLLCLVWMMKWANATPTTNLTTHLQTTVIPLGATLEWHNALPVNSGNVEANPSAVAPGLYYAVYNFGSCYSVPMPIRVATNTCPATTVDLKLLIDSASKPAGSVISYHTASPVSSSNQLSNNLVSAAPAGTYYVAYYDATAMCYTSESVIVNVNSSCSVVCNSGISPNTDLSTHLQSSTPLPSGTTLEWYDSTGNLVINPSATAPGLYHAVYNYGNGCQSDPTYLRIAVNTCPIETVNLSEYVDSVAKPMGTNVTYHNDIPVSASNQISSNAASTIDSGTYYVAYYDAVAMCYSGVNVIVVVHASCHGALLNPDFMTTFVAFPTTGNVSTNDIPVAGSTYGIPLADSTNPSACIPIVDASGSYTFTCSTPGEYLFLIPVCEPLPCTICTNVPLTVTVLNPTVTTNNPVANPDYASVLENGSIVLNITSNDACQNGATCTLTSPTIVTPPSNGTFNPTTGLYTPTIGYVGIDSFQYSVCDNQSPMPKCDTEWVYITVLPLNSPNSTTAADDYVQIPIATSAIGNVTLNDTDPEGNNQTVVPQNTTINGVNLVLDSNGAFIVVPPANFSGPIEFPYTLCDNGTPQACSQATLRLLVVPTNIPLPARLEDFFVIENNCNVTLNWKTTSEINTSYFGILRKELSETEYRKIGQVTAAGNSSSVIGYSFNDANVEDGQYSYRLNVVDIDAKSVMSNVEQVTVNCEAPNTISVYPNPITDKVNILIRNEAIEIYAIKIMDITGRVILITETEVNDKVKNIVLDMSAYASGIYTISVSNPIETKVFKVRKID
jgi:hypothetical protein